MIGQLKFDDIPGPGAKVINKCYLTLQYLLYAETNNSDLLKIVI